MTWSPRLTALAGLSLILLVNLIVLGGVVYNRTGEPESMLRLSERELSSPRPWDFQKENSGLSLEILWRIRDEENERRPYYFGFAGVAAHPTWLDESKLKELGIEPPPTSATEAQKRRYDKQGSKEVFLVLEFDGPTYHAVLQRTRDFPKGQQSEGTPTNRTEEWQAKRLRYEESESSRLFIVDAGTDVARLRAKYPDRGHYAIVKGRIHPPVLRYGMSGRARVEGLAIDTVNVPLELRPVFEGLSTRSYYPAEPRPGPKFEAAVVRKAVGALAHGCNA